MLSSLYVDRVTEGLLQGIDFHSLGGVGKIFPKVMENCWGRAGNFNTFLD